MYIKYSGVEIEKQKGTILCLGSDNENPMKRRSELKKMRELLS